MQRALLVEDWFSARGYTEPAMNRIREIRDAAGMTQEELAEKVGTTANHIWRLETGRTNLTHEWMSRLAEALNCTPADLIANVLVAETEQEVEPVEMDAVASAIAMRGMRVYRVLAKSVVKTGIQVGDVITVDETDRAIDQLKGMEVVLVEIGGRRNKALRQFLPPSLLVTNREGANLAVSLDDVTVTPTIIGVVLR